jgi:hypothetical protein
MMHCSEKAWGHAWLTRNGKTFLRPNRHVLPYVLEKIGENNRYIFWILDNKIKTDRNGKFIPHT